MVLLLNVAIQHHPLLDLGILGHPQVTTDTLTHTIHHCRCQRHPRQYMSSRDNHRPMGIMSRRRHRGRASGTVSPPHPQLLAAQKHRSNHTPHHFPYPLTAAVRSANSSMTLLRHQTFPTGTLALVRVRGRGRVRDR